MFKLWGGCDSLDHQALANYLQLKIHPVATYLKHLIKHFALHLSIHESRSWTSF